MPNDVGSNSVFVRQIEDLISEIQQGKKVEQNLELVRKNINREFAINCETLTIVENHVLKKFFGAYVFPSHSTLKRESLFVLNVQDNKKQVLVQKEMSYHIELDSKLVWDIGATPAEITAVLIHEIGHKVFSKEVLFLNRALAFPMVLGTGAAIVFASPAVLLAAIPLLISYSYTTSIISSNYEEIKADSLTVKYGYAKDLHSLLSKLVSDHEIRPLIRSKSELNAEQKVLISWSIKSALQFAVRRHAIIGMVERQMKETDSPTMRKLLAQQLEEMNKIQNSVQVRTKIGLREDITLQESIKSSIELKKRGMSNLEFDEIEVEIDMIESNEDKLYVIERIHRNIHTARQAIQFLENNGKVVKGGRKFKQYNIASKEELVEYITNMQKLLTKAKEVKIQNTNPFQVKVYYPAGDYEEGNPALYRDENNFLNGY